MYYTEALKSLVLISNTCESVKPGTVTHAGQSALMVIFIHTGRGRKVKNYTAYKIEMI